MDQIKVLFADQPGVHTQFVDLMNHFRSQEWDFPTAYFRTLKLIH